jgi:hypothetical protein
MRRRAPAGPVTTELTRDVAAPLAMSGHLATVEARLDGKGPFRFAIDSGSSGMLRITPAMQQALQLATLGEAQVSDPSRKRVVKRPIVKVGAVEIAGARFTGVEATVGDSLGGDGLSGVIGLGLFGALTATLDFPGQELRLTRRPLAPGDHVVPFTADRGIPVIEVQLAALTTPVDVDTGSPGLLSIPAAWSPKLAFTGEPRVVGKGRTTTSEFDIRAAPLRGDLRVAGHTQPTPTIELIDHFPVANLGSRFLRQYAVTFDMPNRRLALAR